MKKLKALKILETLKKENFRLVTISSNKRDVDIDKKSITGAIAELEALENRSCNNCLYFSNSGHGFGLCNKGVSSDFKIGTFYCNKWDVKNECS